jgi:hypothetical protein
MYLTKRDTLKIAVAAGSLWLLGACTIQRGKIDIYSDPSLTPGRIRSIAFLPVRNAAQLPPEAREINQAIGKAFVHRNPGLDRIVSVAEAEEILRPSGVMDDWARLIDVFDSEGVPDGDALRVIGSVLNVDAIMQGELVGVGQRHGRPRLMWGSTVGATGVTIRYSMFATSDVRLLWSASANGLATTASSLEPAPDVMVAINLALKEIYANIPQL